MRADIRDYAIPDLYLAASPDSKTKLLTGFKAAPFVEPATGLAYFRNRWYDPSTGTFLTPDPEGYADSSNLYAGFANDPVNNSDPTGESATFLGGAVGLAWGVGWGIGSSINDCVFWDQCKGAGHYLGQVGMFTLSGAELGASIDLIALGGGSVSATIGGAGFDSAIAAFSGDWGEYGRAQVRGGAFGLGTWAAIRGAAAVPGVSSAAAWFGETALVRGASQLATSVSERSGLSYFGSELSRLSAKHGFDDLAGTSVGLWAKTGINARGLAAEDAVLGIRGKPWADPDRLPPGMDVLDAFGRNAHSVKSVDTTLRSVRTAGGLYERISGEMYVLHELEDDIAKSGVRITREMLVGKQRVLTYALPPNQPLSAAQRQGIATTRALAGDLGLGLRFRYAKHVRTSWLDFVLK